MQNICQSSESSTRTGEPRPVSAALGHFRDREKIDRITALYEWVGANITTCQGCDELTRIDISDKDETLLFPCPVFSPDCKRGDEARYKAERQALQCLENLIPRRLLQHLPNPKPTPALTHAQQWDFSRGGTLYLYGDTGTGKSFAAAWLLYNQKLRSFLHNLRFSMDWNTSTSAFAWMSAYRAVNDKTLQSLASYVPVLVLDDLGEEVPTDAVKAAMSDIINERYNNDRCVTIITSNQSIGKIGERYASKRFEERLLQQATIVQCLGESLRFSA